MPIPSTSFIAALYERQDDPRHPMGWPHRLLTASQSSWVPADDCFEQRPNTLKHNVLRGAQRATASPLRLVLGVPAVVVLAGGTAPIAAGVLVGITMLLTGRGGRESARQFEEMDLSGAPASFRMQIATTTAVLAYGVLGCLTELPMAHLGRFGAAYRQAHGATTQARALGWAAECTGYGLALALGACLTAGRLVTSVFLGTLFAAASALAAVSGGLWGLGGHLFSAGTQAQRPAHAGILPPQTLGARA